MSKGKLAGIIVACTIAIIVTIVLVISPLHQTPEEEEDYAVYLWYQHEEALEIYSKLNDLTKDPRPDSITWTHETTDCTEQMEHIKAELTTTRPPRYLTDTLPALADTIYETSLDSIDHLTKSAYLLLDAAHAEYMADELSESPAMRIEYQLKALDYLREAKAELDESGEKRDLLGTLLTTCPKP